MYTSDSRVISLICIDTVSEFHAEAPPPTVSEGLAQGPYVAARAGFEPTNPRSTAIDSTKEPMCPTYTCMYV